MSASYKDLKSVIDSINTNSTIEDLDRVFSAIVQNDTPDLLLSMKLMEDFLIESLKSSNELKKVS